MLVNILNKIFKVQETIPDYSVWQLENKNECYYVEESMLLSLESIQELYDFQH